MAIFDGILMTADFQTEVAADCRARRGHSEVVSAMACPPTRTEQE